MKLTTLDSATAFAITGLDRYRFNEAVSDGHYKVAPTTGVGKSRCFSHADLDALFCFSRHLAQGDPPRRAGKFASLIAETLAKAERKKNSALPKEIVIAIGLHGATEVHVGGALRADALVKGEPLFLQMVYSLENIEALLAERVTQTTDEPKPPKVQRKLRRRWGED